MAKQNQVCFEKKFEIVIIFLKNVSNHGGSGCVNAGGDGAGGRGDSGGGGIDGGSAVVLLVG